MEKVISDSKKRRLERNEKILKDFNECMENGSDRSAVYSMLSEKYELSFSAIVKIILSANNK